MTSSSRNQKDAAISKKWVRTRIRVSFNLRTYLNIVADWQANGYEDVVKGLRSMLGNNHAVTVEEFDTWYEELLGAIKAKGAYASYAAEFAKTASMLGHPGSEYHPDDLIMSLGKILWKLKGTVPKRSYDVVKGCLKELREKLDKKDDPKIAELTRNMDDNWSSLILGYNTPADLISDFWKTLAIIGTGLVGIGLVVPIAIGVDLTTYVIPYLNAHYGILGAALSNINTDFQFLVPVLSAIGLTAAGIAKKIWDLLKLLDDRGNSRLAIRAIMKGAMRAVESEGVHLRGGMD